ncbi:hypothetical protein ACSYG7_12860 [Bacillus velezensis]|uniref:hypothetical protein n=1 Tax=Bacillus TaxID=1386 RepID=UPI0003971C9A|nr:MULTISPECIES: hypothetical protein [Bacillus amyloliquefaciens group]HDR6219849.1 hypothetical protein [Bacillus cereus]ERH56137.1 hypothetical protein O205_06555 [Bacillus amyloliquefaciens EGD-AQ14]MCY9464105.1 hypothetical protein [Bacillus velezensis]NRF36097.1 hypothetical protein [Bacillus velezensis]QAR57583.1 hypothetical protein EBA29_02559 [Bacillus velezensis]
MWDRTFQLGKKAIDSLVKEGMPVTRQSISKRTKELDPTSKGIHPNSVKTNTDLYCYYQEYSISYRKKKRLNDKKNRILEVDDAYFRKIKSSRDKKIAEKKFMKMTKQEVVGVLLKALDYITDNEDRWYGEHFKKSKKFF